MLEASAESKPNRIVLERLETAVEADAELDLLAQAVLIVKPAVLEQKPQETVPVFLKPKKLEKLPDRPADFANMVARARSAEVV